MRWRIAILLSLLAGWTSAPAMAQIVFPDGTTQNTAFGGANSTVTGANATVAGGADNTASGNFSTVGGGSTNTASGEAATVSGGFSNTAGNIDSTVGGGSDNDASGSASTIGGGQQNIASADASTVGGGLTNESAVANATIGGGTLNFSAGDAAAIAGGFFNDATNLDAAVGGGSENIASGVASTIPGGSQNTAAGDLSFATGLGATVDAAHDGAMLFADSQEFFFFSERANEFAVRGTGGFRLVSGVNASGVPATGVQVLPGGSQWFAISDRNAKTNFEDLDVGSVLDRVANIPIQEWNYKAHDESVRHIGPMAQDFREAFGLGFDDKHISSMDLGGVALAAIQGLYKQVREENRGLRDALEKKDAELETMENRIAALELRLNALETQADSDTPSH